MTWEGTAGGWDLSPRESLTCPSSGAFTPWSCERMFTQWSWQERRYSLCPRGQGSNQLSTVWSGLKVLLGPIPSVGRYWALDFVLLFLVQQFLQGTSICPSSCLKHQQSPPRKTAKETAISSSQWEFPLITPKLKADLYATIPKACLMPCTFTVRLLFKSRNCKGCNK